jgi:hypothetical protein
MTLAQKLYEARFAQLGEPAPVPFEHLNELTQASYEDLASVATLHLTGSDAATANARLGGILDVLGELLPAIDAERADRKGIEYTTAEMQERRRRVTRLLREVRALVVEVSG